ncbi:hypothetical protein D3C73_1377940 [compost metagenome]
MAELLVADAVFQSGKRGQVSKRRIVTGDIGFDDQRVGAVELFQEFGGQRGHFTAAHMNTANQMKMAIAGQRDVDSRPGIMVTA